MTLAIKETCSGKTGIVDQKSFELDKGSAEDAAAEVDISLYFYNLSLSGCEKNRENWSNLIEDVTEETDK